MKTFKDYYDKKLKDLAKSAKRDKVSVKRFLTVNYHKTISEYKEWQKGFYNAKDCHSFWHRECENKGIECHRCNKFYSTADWDKMSKKAKNAIK